MAVIMKLMSKVIKKSMLMLRNIYRHCDIKQQNYPYFPQKYVQLCIKDFSELTH